MEVVKEKKKVIVEMNKKKKRIKMKAIKKKIEVDIVKKKKLDNKTAKNIKIVL